MLAIELVLGLGSSFKFSFSWPELLNSRLIAIVVTIIYLTVKALILSKYKKTILEYRYNRLKSIPEVISEVVKRENLLKLPDVSMHFLSFGHLEDNALKAQVFSASIAAIAEDCFPN